MKRTLWPARRVTTKSAKYAVGMTEGDRCQDSNAGTVILDPRYVTVVEILQTRSR
jgi:hypothetical protein